MARTDRIEAIIDLPIPDTPSVVGGEVHPVSKTVLLRTPIRCLDFDGIIRDRMRKGHHSKNQGLTADQIELVRGLEAL